MLILRTLLSLALVLALIGLLAWIAKRYLRPDRWLLSRPNASLKLIERFAIDSKKSLLVVDWNHKRLLLGASENTLSLLDSCEASVAASRLGDRSQSETAVSEGRA